MTLLINWKVWLLGFSFDGDYFVINIFCLGILIDK